MLYHDDMVPEWKKIPEDGYMFREKLMHTIAKDYGDSLTEVRRWRYADIMNAVALYRMEDEIIGRAKP